MQEYYHRDIENQLRFDDDYVGPIDFPEDRDNPVTSLCGLFARRELKKGCYLRNFDTSKVTGMSHMFWACKLPEGFTLGDKFDTSKVLHMCDMFSRCSMPQGFTLGNKFDTRSVVDMSRMFYKCSMPEGFTLDNKIDTNSVIDMSRMFCGAVLPEGFTLGEKFIMRYCSLGEVIDFTASSNHSNGLKGKFVVNLCEIKNMFDEAKLPSCCDGLTDPLDIIEALKGRIQLCKAI